MEDSKVRLSTQQTLSAFLRGFGHKGAAALDSLSRGELPSFPHIDECTSTFAIDYQAHCLLKKCRDPLFGVAPPSDGQLVEEAVSSFLEVDHICSLVNRGSHPGWVTFDGNTIAPEAVLFTAERKIRALLGEFSWDEFSECIDFSNGASTRLNRARGGAPFKFSGRPHVTRECALLAVNLIWFHEPWRRFCQDRFGRESDPCSWVQVVRGSEYFTVPKTASKLRGACKEAELNLLCQKSIGTMLKRRLKRVGINLFDQSRNRELARIGSRTGSLATLDLRNASDSVSLALLDLLPDSWKKAILMTRSSEVLLPNGAWHRLAKVSSMGNGFTFELESLLFWALTSSVCDLHGSEDRRIGVFGDDIICHHSYAPTVVEVLSYCGFETNPEKSFISGPFRESCGGHFHYGVDVTPFYLRTGLQRDEDKYHFLNSAGIWMKRHLDDARLFRYMVRRLFPDGVIAVPPSAGTKAGLLVPSLLHAPRIFFSFVRRETYKCGKTGKRRRRWVSCQQYAFTLLVGSSRSRKFRSAPGYLSWLLSASHDRLGEVLVVDEVREPRYKVAYTSEWGDVAITFPGDSVFS